MNEIRKAGVEPDEWQSLKAYTNARIALGRTGVSVPLREALQFKLAHAHAKDAVYSALDMTDLQNQLAACGLPVYCVRSRAIHRDMYLQRPDLGRLLDERSAEQLQQIDSPAADICIIVADGLSATAITQNAIQVVSGLVEKVQQTGFSLAPIVLVEQGRVAIMDAIGSLLNARLAIILIGERPGLSSFDSMGAYITYAPRPGLTDESRNCISNIREQGLAPVLAVDNIMDLIRSAFRFQLTGVQLKADSNADLLSA
ncbi:MULTISPECIES: ethanolamine ammonia-lyase subunit EutC [unclassified Spirosoma]|uniref:ethanolamine ammonia-lyase subunit EutC n=1 Tax=unclassified Spirosoma TaxID=2621999 RepID=UPI00095B3F44|nr:MULTISPECIES: ethanolamine ammonia-lyase subunit EutC [unclassified Spirosoma]MBN8821075.1 ethanolamine ammonia-lyase subunit EutC [Spirosoma sp.]OJW79286.1 MAG: ethanolamine ammonia-lyase [Spirosoma sp. 48-14]